MAIEPTEATEATEAPELTETPEPVEMDLPIDASPEDEGVMAAVDEALSELDPEAPAADPEETPEPEATTEESDEPPAEPEATEETEEPPAEPEDEKPSDEFGELPENTKQETKERFETLKTKFDDVSTERDTLQEQLNSTTEEYAAHVERTEEFADAIRSTGTGAEQFGQIMEYLTRVNSGDPDRVAEAYDMMLVEMQTLGKALGREVPGFDPLDDHPDLKLQYDSGDITREVALEVVQARAAKNLQAAAATTQTAKTTQTADAKQQALDSLTNVGNMIRDFDPHYEHKKEQLIEITQQVVQSEPDSSKWPALITAEYKKIPNPAPPPAPRPTAPAPIRPGTAGSGGGSVAKKPGSAEEAVELALAQL